MSVFYVCACKRVLLPKFLIDSIETKVESVQCLVAAARIQCRDFDEAERIVAKAQEQVLGTMPKKMKDRLSEMTDEERWTMLASATDANMDAEMKTDKMTREAIRKNIEQFSPRLPKRIKDKLQGLERPSREMEIGFKHIEEIIRRGNIPAYEYPVFGEQEVLKNWDAIDLAAAQHHFEQWRHSKANQANSDEKAFCVLHKCAGIANFLEDQICHAMPMSHSVDDDLHTILHKYPFPRTAEERALWIRAGEVADIEKTVDTATLRKYRSSPAAEKTTDGLAGRDKDGRIWRKPGLNGQVLYLISSLRNQSK